MHSTARSLLVKSYLFVFFLLPTSCLDSQNEHASPDVAHDDAEETEGVPGAALASSGREPLASSVTFSVAGGGTLTASMTSRRLMCDGEPIGVTDYTNFSYSLDGVTNPTTTARAVDQEARCFRPTTADLHLTGGCNISFDPTTQSPGLICKGIPGYAGLKYLVVGITYAPPGPASFAEYSTGTSFETATSISDSFSVGASLSVGLEQGLAVGVAKGKVTTTLSASTTQSVTQSGSVSLGIQNLFTTRVPGTPNQFSPIDHDYDLIWLWLNPVALLTVFPKLPSSPFVVKWQGYGFDLADQPAMDIFPIEVGYLNGHFGPLRFTDASVLARSWASNGKVYPPDHGPGLTSQDFVEILRAHPFSSGDYSVVLNPATSPLTTVDGRFTIASALNSSAQSFVYRQPAPGSSPITQTLTNSYSDTSSLAASTRHETQIDLSVDSELSGSFLVDLKLILKASFTFTTSFERSRSTTNTRTEINTLSITGPACGSNVPPCIPEYTGPSQFNVYQDNIFGSFLFNPAH